MPSLSWGSAAVSWGILLLVFLAGPMLHSARLMFVLVSEFFVENDHLLEKARAP